MRRLIVLALSLSGSMAAQQSTSPRGYLAKGGEAAVSLGMTTNVLGSNAWQLAQLDETQRGRPQTIRAMHLRRSSHLYERASSIARTLSFKARMGHGDYSKAGSTRTLAGVLRGSWTSVFPSGSVNFPDMTKRPGKSPAAWSLRVPFKTPFVYDGRSALLFQITAWKAKATTSFGYSLDAVNETAAMSWGEPVSPGNGCKHGQDEVQALAGFQVGAGPGPAILFAASFPQVTQQAYLTVAFVGLKKANLSVPGLCAPLLVDPVLTLAMSDPAFREDGVRGWSLVAQFPHATSFVGRQIYMQTWAPDATQRGLKLAGSRAWCSGPYPAKPQPTTKTALSMSFSSSFGVFDERAAFQTHVGVIVGLEK